MKCVVRAAFAAGLAAVCFNAVCQADTQPTEANSFRVTPYVQHPAKDAVTLMWLAQTNGNASVSWWVQGGAETNTIPSATEIQPTDRVANSRFTADGVLQYCRAPELGYDQSVEAGDNYPAYQRETVGSNHEGAGWSMPYTVPYQYRVRLTGLRPGTTYGYRVTLAGGVSYEKTFRTSPDGWRNMRFIYYSDSETEPADNTPSKGRTTDWTDPATGQGRTYYATQTEAYASNLAAVVSFKPDLIVMAGDLAQKGSRQCDWDEFWRHNAGPLNDPAGSIPIVASPGNHDYWSYQDGGEAGMRKYMSYFEYEPNGAAVDDDQQERFHRVDYGPVTFIFLDGNNGDDSKTDPSHDTNHYFARTAEGRRAWVADTDLVTNTGCRAPDFNPGSAQYAWLEMQLRDAQKKSAFIFVVSHQCPYSVGDHGQPNTPDESGELLSGRPLRVLEPLLHKYGVTAWLAGHDEMMERSTVTGTETCVDGTERPHTLQIWDMGIAGDGLRGGKKIDNPQERFRADKDSAEVYGADGHLTDGGKHYGHLEISITEREDGAWVATFDPVYEFFTTNEKGEAVYGGTRHYADKVEIVNESTIRPPVPAALSSYITNGLIAFWDGTYNSTNETGGLCHDSSATVWLDLSGGGHDARVATTIPPYWGDDYFNTSNSVNGKSSLQCRMDFTPSEDFLAAINDVHFTYQACFKVNTWISNTGFFGCRDSGGIWGMRTDVNGNISFAIRDAETSMGTLKQTWLDGCVHSFSADGRYYNTLVNESMSLINGNTAIGSAPTLGNGRIGGPCAKYTADGDYRFYAGRVYNRALTGVEMAYNAAIDRVRYFNAEPRATVNVSSYSSTHVNYSTATPAYDKLTATTVGAAQTFSVAGVAEHPFDDEIAYAASAASSSRALYLGASITTIAADGSESTVDYPKTVISVPVTVGGDMFATWKWKLQYRYLATAAKGGTLRVGDSTEPVGAYTNWYTAADAVQVTVTAVPDEGFAFSAWEGDFAGEASSPTMTVTLTAAKTLTATFVRSGKGDGSTYIWKGGSSNSWLDGNNWDRGFPPLEGDRVVISPKANSTILVNAAPPHLLSFVLGGSNGTATVQFQNWDAVLTADEVTIKDKGVLQPVSAFTDTESSNRVAVVCNNFTLEAGASINASGKGWVAPKANVKGSGPGGGQQNRGGGGYGGRGGCGYAVRNAAQGNPYGSLTAPTDPGSGGGQSGNSGGGAGGGAVLIRAANNIRIDGSIRADGTDSSSAWGSGSGGGVYLSCRTFEGAGTITARGGASTGGTNGGGGGGRIAIVYDVEAQAAVSPKPAPVLHAGARRYGAQYGCYPPTDRLPTLRDYEHQCGTPGTVYLADDSFYPGDIWSKCSGLFHFGTETGGAYELDDPSFADEASVNSSSLAQDVWFHDHEVSFPNGLTLPKYAHVVFTNCTVHAKSLLVSSGCFDLRGHSTLVVEGDAVAEGTGRFNFEAGPTNGVEAATWNPWGQTVKVGGKLWLKDTSVLYPVSHSVNGGSVNFELCRLEVASGASVNGVSCGFGYYNHMTSGGVGGWGPGGSGAGNIGPAHGGFGGGAGKQNQRVYGDERHPTLPGTDGGRWGSYVGGWGGGLFHATVAKSAVVDGMINMNGRGSYDTQSCGSSGGGVYLSCGTLKGSGSITANGAGGTSSVNYSGSGGGGRIAVYGFDTNSWYGTMTAAAGTNAYTYTSSPTAGTVYVKVPRGLKLIVR